MRAALPEFKRAVAQSGLFKGALIHPDPKRDSRDFSDWILKYLEFDSRRIVLPINEAVLSAINDLRHSTIENCQAILPSHKALEYALSKFRATRAAMELGIRVPETVFLRAPNESFVEAIPVPSSYPCVIKWDNFETEHGGYDRGGLSFVQSLERFNEVLAELIPSSGGVLAQQIVAGRGVGAFFLRHNGKTVLRFAHRRLHEVPWTGGVSSLCEASNDMEVLEAGERLLEAIDYEGVAMVEFRKEEGRPPVFLEINGRLWGSLGLALAAGADFPRAMVECHVRGETAVAQPNLSRRIRWRDPKLELDYLHSLWERQAGPGDPRAPKWSGSLSVLWHWFDPRTKSDWQWGEGVWQNLRRHLGLWRRESARLRQAFLRLWQGPQSDALVVETAARTTALLAQAAASPPQKLLFLCYGNICRSPYAEFRWVQWSRENPLLPHAISAGFHQKVERPTPLRFQSAARHRGVELEGHRSKLISKELIAGATWVIAMDALNLRQFQKSFPGAMAKTLLLGACDRPGDPTIPDPYDQPIGAGGDAYRRIDAALEALRGALAVPSGE